MRQLNVSGERRQQARGGLPLPPPPPSPSLSTMPQDPYLPTNHNSAHGAPIDSAAPTHDDAPEAGQSGAAERRQVTQARQQL
jgi:hypothetical protein